MQTQTDPQPDASRPRHGVALRASALAQLATASLVAEATLTPKPGLVDRRGCGAHHDLTLKLLLVSAQTLEPWFTRMARAAELTPASQMLREQLAAIGRGAERDMLTQTGGVNTHRGAIWSLGLLVAAATLQPTASPVALCFAAGELASFPDRHAPVLDSHGEQARLRFGATGARGEAINGFPHVRLHALPALHAARRQGLSEDLARLHTLLALVAKVPDTCLLHRGGLPALAEAQRQAAYTLSLGGLATPAGQQAFATLDRTLLRLWASPGGSADLLSATLFLDSLAAPESTFTAEVPTA